SSRRKTPTTRRARSRVAPVRDDGVRSHRKETVVFVQVIEGRVNDETALRRLVQRWDAEVGPGATGFLGITAGVAADGTAIAFVRYIDDAAAGWNRGRSEYTSWWEELMAEFAAPPVVDESADVQLLLAGGSDDADFVQVLRAPRPDRAKID